MLLSTAMEFHNMHRHINRKRSYMPMVIELKTYMNRKLIYSFAHFTEIIIEMMMIIYIIIPVTDDDDDVRIHE